MPNRPTPPIVTVMCVLLYIGGGLTLFSSLFGLVLFQTLYGVIILLLAWRLHRGERWAWWGLAALCAVSVVVTGVYIGLHGLRYATNLAWPTVYLILLTRLPVRQWFFDRPPLPETP
ncbi:hypothetical protein [Actinoplanes sp. HUAS TT8]|uniref:hypothetical protein n=1 Tax=Actinoplanes sp. HUAS TT8 TaxID=3447453 RepID=UPI003F526DAD